MKREILLTFVFIFCQNQLQAQLPEFYKKQREKVSDIKDNTVMSEAYWKLWSPVIQNGIDANIEKYRKANASFKLKGIPAGTEVKVEQLDHDFQFGAHIFNFDQLGSNELNRKYKKLFGTLYNPCHRSIKVLPKTYLKRTLCGICAVITVAILSLYR